MRSKPLSVILMFAHAICSGTKTVQAAQAAIPSCYLPSCCHLMLKTTFTLLYKKQVLRESGVEEIHDWIWSINTCTSFRDNIFFILNTRGS